MSKTVCDFYYAPPSVYPIPVTSVDPAFATSNSEVYGPNFDREVFRRSMTYAGKDTKPAAHNTISKKQLRRHVLDSADYYVASSLKNTKALDADERHYSRTLAEKGFSGLPLKPELASEELNKTKKADTRQLKRTSDLFTKTATQSLDSNKLFTTSTKFKAMDYTRDGTNDDMRRSMHETLRNTQNARFLTYKRSYGRF